MAVGAAGLLFGVVFVSMEALRLGPWRPRTAGRHATAAHPRYWRPPSRRHLRDESVTLTAWGVPALIACAFALASLVDFLYTLHWDQLAIFAGLLGVALFYGFIGYRLLVNSSTAPPAQGSPTEADPGSGASSMTG